MRCTSCGHDNPNGSLFCQQCGSRFAAQAPATVTCSRCRSQQPANLRFCTTCGNALQGAAPAAQPAAAQPAAAPAAQARPAAAAPAAQPAQPAFQAPAYAAPAPQPQAAAPQFAPQPAYGQPGYGQPPYGQAPQGGFGAAPQPAYGQAPQGGFGAAPQGGFAQPAPGYPQPGMQPTPAHPPMAAPAAPKGPPVCWRCRGQGDVGHEFCKFCGARYADAPGDAATAVAPSPMRSPSAQPMQPAVQAPAAQPAVPAQPAYAPQAVAAPRTAPARLVSILKDGSDGQSFPLPLDQSDIGRTEGELVLADDPYLSPRHARIRRVGEGFALRDLESVNGIYVRLRDSVDLSHGDFILVGQQVLRFEVLEDSETPYGPASVHGVMVFGTPETQRAARLVQYTTEGLGRDVAYVHRNETVLGRETGDLVFTDDPFLSRRHAAVRFDRAAKKFSLVDLGSSNGTFVRLRGERTLAHQDQFRVGRHLFRFELASAVQGQGAR